MTDSSQMDPANDNGTPNSNEAERGTTTTPTSSEPRGPQPEGPQPEAPRSDPPPSVRRRRIPHRMASHASSTERLTSRSRGGIVGRNWWAQRWSQLLGDTGLADRLHRGRALARSGSVFGFRIEAGEARGEVRHSRTELHEVSVRQTAIGDEDWNRIFDILSTRAKYVAGLLNASLDEAAEEQLAAANLSLFPADWDTFDLACSCQDPALPCSHLAAVFYLMAERIDNDPFLLFRFRGCRRDTILSECRLRRSTASTETDTSKEETPSGDRDLAADEFASDTDLVATLTVNIDEFWGAELAEFNTPSPSDERMELLTELGLPPQAEEGSLGARALREGYALGQDIELPTAEELLDDEDDDEDEEGDENEEGIVTKKPREATKIVPETADQDAQPPQS